MENLITTIEAAIADQGHSTTHGTVRVGHTIRARDVAAAILDEVVPAGTLRWMCTPEHRESVRAFARRAVETAAARASWAGGLRNGTQVADAAIVASVATLVRMSR